MSAQVFSIIPAKENVDEQGRLPTQHERNYEFLLREPELIRIAICAEQFAFNWRGANYGCALLACRKAIEPAARFGIFPGWNFKPTCLPVHENDEKLCAEIMGKREAFDMGFEMPVGLVLFSRYLQKADDITGRSFHTPHPCWECVDRYHELGLESVRFVTCRPAFPGESADRSYPELGLVIERRSLHEIMCLHLDLAGP